MEKLPSGGAFLSSLILEELRVDISKEAAQGCSLAQSPTGVEELIATLLNSTFLESGEDVASCSSSGMGLGLCYLLNYAQGLSRPMFIDMGQNLARSFHNVTVKSTDF